MNKQLKKKNHFVPKFYLSEWMNNGVLNVFDINKSNSYTKTKKQLDETGFCYNLYTMNKKINSLEILFFKEICKIPVQDTDPDDVLISLLIKYLNDELGSISSVKITSKTSDIKHEIAAEILNNAVNNVIKSINNPESSRRQEELFNLYETDYQKSLQIIKNNGIQALKMPIDPAYSEWDYKHELFYDYMYRKLIHFIYPEYGRALVQKLKDITKENNKIDTNFSGVHLDKIINISYYDILHYMLIQHFRTPKKFLALNKLNLSAFESIDVNKSSFPVLLTHYLSVYIVNMWTLNSGKLILLRNATNTKFITSDNPCVQIINNLPSGNFFELYFPITPELSLIYSYRDCYNDCSEIIISNEKDIIYYNELIRQNAIRYIYSFNKIDAI